MTEAQGTHTAGTSVEDQPRDVTGEAAIAFGRAAWIGTVSGAGVGLLMGVLNRLVMRIVAVQNGPTDIETDFGAKVLNFTTEGTIGLIIGTTRVAVVPGMLYVGLRRRIPGGTMISGLVFGLLLATTFGAAIVDSRLRDFRLLGVPQVSAAMFLGMFVLFGLLVAPVAARLDTRVSRTPSDRVFAGYLLVAALMLLIGIQVVFKGPWSWLILVPLGFAMAVSAGERTGARWTEDRRLVRAGGYLALAIPFGVGLIDLVGELTLIARA